MSSSHCPKPTTMRPLRAYLFAAALSWPDGAAAIHRPSSSSGGIRQWRSLRVSKTSGLDKSNCRRQLSAEEQLDILKLGFIPTSRSEDEDESASRYGRGGGMDVDERKNRKDSQMRCRRNLSEADQRDILKLGFVPPSREDDDMQSNSSFIRKYFSLRGGGIDVDVVTDTRRCRRQLSEADQLCILKLGFIPSSSDDGESAPKKVDMTKLRRRGGSIDVRDAKSGRTLGRSKASRAAKASGPDPDEIGLTEGDQLDILQLGLIPPSEDEEPHTFLHPTNTDNAATVEKSKLTLTPLAFASAMAFLAGYSHVLCFMRFQAYASMMSGNLMATSAACADGDWETAAWRASLVGGYFVGATGARTIELACQKKNKETPGNEKSKSHLKVIAPIVAAVFAVADRAIGTSTFASDGLLSNLFLLALGYGMIYSSANKALGGMITQLFTGHLTKLAGAIPDRFLGPERRWNEGTGTSACTLGLFIVGGIISGRVCQILPEDFPIFALIGIVYAVTLALF